MLRTDKFNPYDVIVCGAGHAGCEAALAAARRGLDTLLIPGNLDTIAQMSCNPSIGGLAKGNIVREIDALGGEMALNADATGIQFRVLNSSKGPAVQGPRAQCDKKAYQFRMKEVLERAKNLSVFQAIATRLIVQNGAAAGVETNMGVCLYAKTVILTTGTFLKGLMHVGSAKTDGGRMGDFCARSLSASLIEAGIALDRLKTGTPARILGKSIDFSRCAPQGGDEFPELFAFYDTRTPKSVANGESGEDKTERLRQEGGRPVSDGDAEFRKRYSENYAALWHEASFGGFEGFGKNQVLCYETHTTEKTAQIIRANLEKSAMYGGMIHGIGPRYCPSIEDKIVRFADKPTHRLYLEPEGRFSDEWYINGLSTSMPVDVQLEIIKSVTGLENAQMMRPAYAVEYDFAPPTQISNSLESKIVEGLFCAGQINGTSGYEEAAGQGLIAGVNAAAKVLGLKPLILGRHESYIGTLIDDLATKGTQEPYRMFTSRAEFRLLLNHNSAELRMYAHAKEYALVDAERLEKMADKLRSVEKWTRRIESDIGLAAKLRRQDTPNIDPLLPKAFLPLSKSIRDEVLYRVIFGGYLARELRQIEKMGSLEGVKIPAEMDFKKVSGLRLEAAQKLGEMRPNTIGQASRISGVSPADINVLAVAVKAFGRRAQAPAKESSDQ